MPSPHAAQAGHATPENDEAQSGTNALGPKDQSTADGADRSAEAADKARNGLTARLALAGWTLIPGTAPGSFTAAHARWGGRTRELRSLREAEDFANTIGAPR
jgi:hypothetical protein